MEVVHLDEVVQVDTQQLERDAEMFAEGEGVEALDDILLVFRIVLVQRLDQPGLDKTLLEESLLIFENFPPLFLFSISDRSLSDKFSFS